MADSYAFVSGEPVEASRHGNTELVYLSGEPVPDRGTDGYVFESGNSFNSGGLLWGPLFASDTALSPGGSTEIRRSVTNPTDENLTAEFVLEEDGNAYASSSVTVNNNSSYTFEVGSPSVNDAPEFRTYVSNPGEPSESEELSLAWLAVDIGNLYATKYLPEVGGTTTMKVDVANTGDSDASVSADFRQEDGGSVGADSANIPSGGSTTLQTDVSRSSETTQRFVAEVSVSGYSVETNAITVEWTNGGLFADAGDTGSAVRIQPTYTQSHAAWYNYDNSQANAPANIPESGTGITVTYDGNTFAVAIIFEERGSLTEASTSYPIDSTTIVRDDPEGGGDLRDDYFDAGSSHTWTNGNTDGVMVNVGRGFNGLFEGTWRETTFFNGPSGSPMRIFHEE